LLGPLARRTFDEAKGVATVALVALLAVAVAYWIVRKGRRRAMEGWREAACPVCLGLAEVVRRVFRTGEARDARAVGSGRGELG
jgi:hypothetical protein